MGEEGLNGWGMGEEKRLKWKGGRQLELWSGGATYVSITEKRGRGATPGVCVLCQAAREAFVMPKLRWHMPRALADS